MHYAVIHCRNLRCLLKVWVPESQLGKRGRCPKCGGPLQAPGNVPPEELMDGPAIMQVQEEYDREHAMAATA